MSENTNKEQQKKPYHTPELIEQGHITKVTKKSGDFGDVGGGQFHTKQTSSGETP